MKAMRIRQDPAAASTEVNLIHSFVLMPHARTAHQPRSASKATNTPAAASPTPSQTETENPKAAPTSNASARKPRTNLPLLSMFGRKNDFMAWPDAPFMRQPAPNRNHKVQVDGPLVYYVVKVTAAPAGN